MILVCFFLLQSYRRLLLFPVRVHLDCVEVHSLVRLMVGKDRTILHRRDLTTHLPDLSEEEVGGNLQKMKLKL